MQNLGPRRKLLLLVFTLISAVMNGQDSLVNKNDLSQQVDAHDVIRNIFGVSEPVNTKPKKASLAILPSFSYNPSFGFIIGASVTGGMQLGDPVNTEYYIIYLFGSY